MSGTYGECVDSSPTTTAICRPDFTAVTDWLAAHTPTESGATLIHCDYRIGNVILAPGTPGRIAAVLTGNWPPPVIRCSTSATCWPPCPNRAARSTRRQS